MAFRGNTMRHWLSGPSSGKSNFCAPGGYVSAAITPRPGGGSRVHIVWNRTPTTFGGRMAAFFIVRTKGRPVAGSFNRAMKILERTPV